MTSEEFNILILYWIHTLQSVFVLDHFVNSTEVIYFYPLVCNTIGFNIFALILIFSKEIQKLLYLIGIATIIPFYTLLAYQINIGDSEYIKYYFFSIIPFQILNIVNLIIYVRRYYTWNPLGEEQN